MTKECRRCHVVKPASAFGKYSRNKDGLTPYCKPCAVDRQMEWRARHPEKVRAAELKRYLRRKERNIATHGRAIDPIVDGMPYTEYVRLRNARNVYGLTKEEYLALPQFCLICGSTEQLHVDHSHVTGKVRGRLCRRCNQGIGQFRDNPALLLNAIHYLTV